jgi:hypothetical protein
MPMRFLDTKRRGDTRHFLVWLDIAKVLADGTTPDPDWTASIEFPATPPAGLTAAAYRDLLVERAKGFARATLAERLARDAVAGSDLAVTGTDFV